MDIHRITEIPGVPKPLGGSPLAVSYAATHTDIAPIRGVDADGSVPDGIGGQVALALDHYRRVLQEISPQASLRDTTNIWMLLSDLKDVEHARTAYANILMHNRPALSILPSQVIAPDNPGVRVALVPKVHDGRKKRTNGIRGWVDFKDPSTRILRSGPHVYLSGISPYLPRSGVLHAGDVRDQMKQTMENTVAVLKAMKLSWKNSVRSVILVRDLADFGDMSEVWGNEIGDDLPTRAVLSPHQMPEGTDVHMITEASTDKPDEWVRRQQIPGAPNVLADYNAFVETGAHFHLAGQLPLDEEGNLVSEDAETQMRWVMRNIDVVMRGARRDVSRTDLIGLTVALTHPEEDFAPVSDVLTEYFKGEGPIITYTHSRELPKGARVEAIADGYRRPS